MSFGTEIEVQGSFYTWLFHLSCKKEQHEFSMATYNFKSYCWWCVWWCQIDDAAKVLCLPSARVYYLFILPPLSCWKGLCIGGCLKGQLRMTLMDLLFPSWRSIWIHKLIQSVHSVQCHVKEEVLIFLLRSGPMFMTIAAQHCRWCTALKLGIVAVLHCGFLLVNSLWRKWSSSRLELAMLFRDKFFSGSQAW